MKKALGYVRVSGRTQATDGTGLLEQRSAIEAWTQRSGYEVVQWFEDAGVSGELAWDSRPGMTALMERLASNGVEAVIVHHMDRIARGKPAIFETIIDLIGGAGVALHSVVDGLLTDNVADDEFQRADKTMMLGIKMNVLRNEKRKLVERMKRGRIRAKADGKHVDGRFAYGTDPSKVEEKITLDRMRQLRDAGITCYRICQILESEGRMPRTAPHWKANVVNQILERSAAKTE